MDETTWPTMKNVVHCPCSEKTSLNELHEEAKMPWPTTKSVVHCKWIRRIGYRTSHLNRISGRITSRVNSGTLLDCSEERQSVLGSLTFHSFWRLIWKPFTPWWMTKQRQLCFFLMRIANGIGAAATLAGPRHHWRLILMVTITIRCLPKEDV